MLIAEHLEKNYRKRRVVKDASYQVDAAQVVGLLGPNGAGKTTSFYMTIGLVRPDRGRILLDEPFAGVDPIAVGDIRNIITHLTDRGIGVLITDHNVRETLKSCDRAYILSDGAIIAEGSPAEIVAHEEARRVYLGEDFTLN